MSAIELEPEGENPRLGIGILAVGTICFGIACFLQRDFAVFWQPVPESLPFRQPLAFLSAALLVLSGAGLLLERTRSIASIVLSTLFVLYAAAWLSRGGLGSIMGIAEDLGVALGAATIWARCAATPSRPEPLAPWIARVAFGTFSVIFGLSHFIGLKNTAEMVPAWLPGSGEFWALATGAGHVAAGVALLTNRLAVVGTRAAGAMYLCFVALVWLPGAVTHPDQWLRWAGGAISLAMLGSIWLIGDYLVWSASARQRRSAPKQSVGG
ncbi:MAG: hypothetical protein J7500_02505 [Sphingomonas sp.]|uniref:hypothetical protein n=1 Tax=Sphingomonas sp. TaxID=28214 RepID=UPI001B17E595|nr:hypothetical protein [Sphingomonas sp.]MBO9621561.1 hypothetical protein [Sphingomonas sp.]